jgi:hypothetical protein
MKRWRDGGFEDEERARPEVEGGPLVVQAVAPEGRGRRFGLPLAIAAAVLIILVAIASRYAAYFNEPTPTPAPPTAIAWIDVTAPPTPLGTPAPTLGPGNTPGEPTPAPTPARTPLPFVDASAAFRAFLFAPGDEIDFTVTLVNASGADIALEPCPTYTMYLVGDTAPHPSWLLNCAAVGRVFEAGDGLRFAMTFVVPNAAEPGENTLVWQMQTGFQAQASLTVQIGVNVVP